MLDANYHAAKLDAVEWKEGDRNDPFNVKGFDT